nr:hypothetical protein CFP56_21571 [Quercus suber]
MEGRTRRLAWSIVLVSDAQEKKEVNDCVMSLATSDRILTALRMFARTGQATRAAPMSHDWSCGTQLGDHDVCPRDSVSESSSLLVRFRSQQIGLCVTLQYEYAGIHLPGKSPDRGMLRHQPRPDRVTSNHSSRCFRTKAGSRLLQYYVPHRNHVRLLFPLSLEYGVEDKAVLEDLKRCTKAWCQSLN